MKGMLDPIFEEKVLGHAEIRQIFKASGVGNIAGSYVLDGTFERGCQVRITRGDEQILKDHLHRLRDLRMMLEVKSDLNVVLYSKNSMISRKAIW